MGLHQSRPAIMEHPVEDEVIDQPDVVCGYDVGLEEHDSNTQASLQLQLASHRFITFPRFWNHMNNRHELVDAGFFFLKNRSQVQCYFCHTCVKVKEDIDIIENHNSYAPDCDMLLGIAHENRPMFGITNYRYESDRLLSFLTTNWKYSISPYELAKSGFFSTGEHDNVRCMFCHLEIKGWTSNDTARGEHVRWNANCPFLRARNVGNVTLDNDANERVILSQEDVKKLRIILSKEGVTAEDLNAIKHLKARHQDYICNKNRLKSFKYWPAYLQTRPDKLCKAGFVYSNIGDRCFTFCCNIVLTHWNPDDDPWEQHARWSFGCQFLQLMKGSKFIADVKKTQLREVQVDEQMTTECDEPTGNVSTELTCKVCCERKVSICILPCGHVATCDSCILQIKNKKCVLCRTEILAYVRAYV
jgi:baculoviral IAP repeat-containing protein 7/8